MQGINNFIEDPYLDLDQVAEEQKLSYTSALPFPHICLPNFFNPKMLEKVLQEFPDLSQGEASKHINQHAQKWASQGTSRLGQHTANLINYLNAAPFLSFLQKLTSIPEKLIPDPYLSGGGLHEIKKGGFLKIHADFNKHPDLHWDRRLNVLLYLNKDWQEEYGGHLELWNKDMTSCVKKIAPVFNTLVVFSTTDDSYHGHPNPLDCPAHMSRKSLALYYYTHGTSSRSEIAQEAHTTLYQKRRGDKADQGNKVKELTKMWTPPAIWNALKKVFSP